MIGLDTNVLVRFLTQDDPGAGQSGLGGAGGAVRGQSGLRVREVLVELVWVLERAYGLDRAAIARAIDGLLEAQELIVEAADIAGLAADRYRKGGAGFSDHMILAGCAKAGCATVLTFDRKAGATLIG